jgi:monothiol glutaredoxin
MKGDRQAPRCGFSATAIGIQDQMLDDYHTVDVLADEPIRQGIKIFGQWPTIPQLYVRGELIGGSDILNNMYNSGELHGMFGLPVPERVTPTIHISESAAEAIRAGLADDPGLALHLKIDPRWQAQFFLKPADGSEIVSEAAGIRIHLDLASARRADGLQIDWVDGLQGSGLAIRNPNAPAPVTELSVSELADLAAKQNAPLLFDVRPPEDQQRYPFALARPLDAAAVDALRTTDRATPLAFICHHGISSRQAAEHFRQEGFGKVYNVSGGVDAWAREVDTTFPVY